jgi:hypothetical protein
LVAGCRDFILISVTGKFLFAARAFTDKNPTGSNSTGSTGRGDFREEARRLLHPVAAVLELWQPT